MIVFGKRVSLITWPAVLPEWKSLVWIILKSRASSATLAWHVLAILTVTEAGVKGKGEQGSLVRGLPVGQNGVEKSACDADSDFMQHWQGASFISWSSSGYPKCRIAPGGASQRKFSLRLNAGPCSIGCSILLP